MKRIALIGNPNSGKSSLFNALTGLNQKTGNYPGVTVERNAGYLSGDGERVEVTDLPGTYSLYPNSPDEVVVSEELLAGQAAGTIHGVIYVADITMLSKELLLLTQVMDLGFPVVMALNMSDIPEQSEIDRVRKAIQQHLGIEVVDLSARKQQNISALKSAVLQMIEAGGSAKSFSEPDDRMSVISEALRTIFPGVNDYGRILIAHHHQHYHFIDPVRRASVTRLLRDMNFDAMGEQLEETMARYNRLEELLRKTTLLQETGHGRWSRRLDRWLVHPVLGPLLFLALMMLVFQAVYSWSQYPMAGIEWIFSTLSGTAAAAISVPWLADLVTNGIIAGMGAILVFIPQIAILFLLLALLEQSGYMARVVYLFDPVMRRVGLSGRSIVALFSGAACAVPAIMSARTIRDSRERLNTILVTPLISCSARLPVYILLIGMLVPKGYVGGYINRQAAVFVLIYVISILVTFAMAWVFKRLLRTEGTGMLLLHLPVYRRPVIRDVVTSVWKKVSAFTWQAGRIIFVISLVIWLASSYGPPGNMQAAAEEAAVISLEQGLDEAAASRLQASLQLEHSFAGILGKTIEPAILPLGYDWKIGIGLISAFAAREVFVGTMATIYSVGDDGDQSLQEKMRQETFSGSGEKVYSMATIISLLLFFLLAMQCMSTLAIVKKETNSWKWPLVQLTYMTVLAVAVSLITYQLLS